MCKTILIPTDFSIESLSLLKVALEEHPQEQLDVLFVYGYQLPTSISELLFHSPGKILEKLETEDFREASAILRNKAGARIRSMKKVLFTGYTKSAFNTFLKVHKVDEVVIPVKQLSLQNNKQAQDLLPFLNAAKTDKLMVSWEARPVMPEENMPAALFAL